MTAVKILQTQVRGFPNNVDRPRTCTVLSRMPGATRAPMSRAGRVGVAAAWRGAGCRACVCCLQRRLLSDIAMATQARVDAFRLLPTARRLRRAPDWRCCGATISRFHQGQGSFGQRM